MNYIVPVVDTNGKELVSITLDATVFAQDHVNTDLIHEYVLMQLANARQSNAHTKTRWEVSFSGKKIKKQKWWWARVGDKWSPLRKKWWVAFGPSNEINRSKTMTKKQRKLALLWAFISKLENKEVIIVDGYEQQKISTKWAYSLLKTLKCDDHRNLVMSGNYDEYLSKSFRNIDDTKYVSIDFMNVVDLLKSNQIMIIGKDGLHKIVERFTQSDETNA